MKILIIMLLAITLGSCAGGWTEEDKAQFKQSCVSSVQHQLNEEQTNTYCSCFTEQMVSMYPVFNDAMQRRDSAKVEEAKAHCRKEIGLNY